MQEVTGPEGPAKKDVSLLPAGHARPAVGDHGKRNTANKTGKKQVKDRGENKATQANKKRRPITINQTGQTGNAITKFHHFGGNDQDQT